MALGCVCGGLFLIYRYILKEVVPQFFVTFIIFCSIIIISQLVRLSQVLIAFGVTFENVLLPFLYILMPFLTLIIPISFFFAVVIAFTRLSADGELAGLLAAGFSLRKAVVPVLLVASVLFGVGVACATYFEAWGRREFVHFRYRKTQTELDNMVRFKMQEGVFLPDFIGYVLYVEKISKDRTKLEKVILAPGPRQKDSNFLIVSPKAEITGSVEEGSLKMVFLDGRSYSQGKTSETSKVSDLSKVMDFDRAEIDLLRVFQDKILGSEYHHDDYRSYRYGKLLSYIDELKTEQDDEDKREQYYKARFLLHSRFSNPFTTVAFAFFGLVLGIQDPRKGKGSAYMWSIITVIASYVFLMWFKWLGENGYVPAIPAAWLPQVVLFLMGVFLIYQKNRLPLNERPLSLSNLPKFR